MKLVIQQNQITLGDDVSMKKRCVYHRPGRLKDEKKSIPVVRMMSKHHDYDRATWKLQDEVKGRCTELFSLKGANFEDEISLRGRGCNTPGF